MSRRYLRGGTQQSNDARGAVASAISAPRAIAVLGVQAAAIILGSFYGSRTSSGHLTPSLLCTRSAGWLTGLSSAYGEHQTLAISDDASASPSERRTK